MKALRRMAKAKRCRLLSMRKVLMLLALAAPAFAQHAIVLGWTDTINPAGTTTYNVYRATSLCPAAPPTSTPPAGFTPIATAVTVTSYTDAAVVPSTIYCYVVTAVVSGGGESAPSNEAQATEPVIMASPPTMLQIKSVK
jgi:hypothetical protein